MNHLQHYLTKLAEEGSEVAQIALKTQQFGPGEVMPGQPLNNFERCHLELDDLWAMVEELNDKFGFGYTPNRERMEAKKAKVLKYLGFSIHLGMVEGETDVCEHPMALPVDVNVRGWMPIETAPANTWILTFAKWDSGRSVGISLFKDVERVVEKVESECHNRKGRRRVVQEETVTEREWEGDHWEPTHWMPLPDAPNVKSEGAEPLLAKLPLD